MNDDSPIVSNLVADEIRRVVATALKKGSSLSASRAAAEILQTYPTCALSAPQLADEIMIVAASAGVAVEIGPVPKSE